MENCKNYWGDLFYDIAGRYCLRQGIYAALENAIRFCSWRNCRISLLLNHVFGFRSEHLLFYKSAPYRDQLSYTGKRFLLKTAKSMVITTFFLMSRFPVFPMYEGQRMMAALCSRALMGKPMVMFYMRALLREVLILSSCRSSKNVHLSVRKITMIIDLGIILLGWPVFGDVMRPLWIGLCICIGCCD